MAGGGQLVGLRAVGEHGPDLACAGAGGFENDVTAVGSPARALVAALVASDLDGRLGRRGIHNIDVVIAAGASPAEGEELAVG